MAMVIRRILYVTDKNGVEHEIKTKADLEAIFAQMTREEYEQWKENYRFCPITNRTGIKDYVGTARDLM